METIKQQEVAQRMEMIRRQLGLTQKELAEQLQISQAAISKYLNARIPPADVLYRLATLGQTTVEWLLTGQKNYWVLEDRSQVREESVPYDADWSLAKKIARLPLEARQALVALIDVLNQK